MTRVCFSVPELSVYVPSGTAAVEDVAQQLRQAGLPFAPEDVARFRGRYGFDRVPVERSKRLGGMLAEACGPLLVRLRRQGRPVDRIVIARTLDLSWHDEHALRELRDAPEIGDTPVFALSQHNCATVHLAMQAAGQLLHAGSAEGIVLVTADKAFHPALKRLPHSLLGDAACACYITREAGPHRTFYLRSVFDAGMDAGLDSLPENVKWFQTTYHFAIRQLIRTALRECGLTVGDLRFIFGSNVNRTTWEEVASMLPCDIGLFYTDTIAKVGHLHGSDLWYNVHDAVLRGKLRRGDRYMTVSVGLGSFGCAVHQY
ncbi:3-oxoacyl-[acyl-carrier-protein] synthase III C-terminal domain-containing protein [Paenibacillus elgii]